MREPGIVWPALRRSLVAIAGVGVPTTLYAWAALPGGGPLVLFYAGVTLGTLLLAGWLGLRRPTLPRSAEPRGMRCLLVGSTTFFYAMILLPGHPTGPWGIMLLLGDVRGAQVIALLGFISLLIALRRGPALAYACWLTAGLLLLAVALLWGTRMAHAGLVRITLPPAAVAAVVTLAAAWSEAWRARRRDAAGAVAWSAAAEVNNP